MEQDQVVRLLALKMAMELHAGRLSSSTDVVAAAFTFYDFLTAEFVEVEADEDEAAPDNAQSYPN
jgi:hypothetical protein